MKKNRIFKTISGAALCTALLTGCSESWLEPKPLSFLTPENAYVDADGLLTSLNAVLVGLGDNLDMLRVLAECLLTVKTDVDRTVRNARHIRDGLENAFLNVVQHVPFTSSRLQPATVCDSSFG